MIGSWSATAGGPRRDNDLIFATKQGKPLEHKLVVQVIAEGRARLGEGGRLVIRESGTEPVIRVMAESDDEGLVAAVVKDVAEAIKQVA